MTMASLCRGFRQALRCRGSILNCGDFPSGVRSFAQRRAPLLDLADPKPRFESPSVLESYLLGKNSSDHIIHDQLRLANAHPCLPKENLSPQDIAVVLRFVNLNAVKRKLREIPEACISYQKLLNLCMDCTKSLSEDEGRDIIKRLEQSGEILRIGQNVYPHPHQISRAVEKVLPRLVDERSIEELRKMEKEKAEIEKKSESMARKELWCGLGFFAVQTMGLFRLTFWELSWDIMEPICFYLTSLYFILGYGFFLRTCREPSFENFYATRVAINRRKLMKTKKFELQRYRELKRICKPGIHHLQGKAFV
ncbi:hypothetical protein SUGI_0503250 [Cryptomeria japonica]|uniref:calcium uniporter protein 2, mitochondrial n=1 Tax=Cryptomeria japonica TaxID=3369 RepID=UPI002408D5F7|nr:calcium uniporter protein 2, mitochondrial [Cryptomeria japonica]GLJ26219.1 hypothetical protein SUGI_0503250 [Cryptomeria japonica]